MAAIIPANSKTDLGKSGTPWTNIYGTNVYQGGQLVVATNDARLPSSDQKAALAGSSGSPSGSNRFITEADRARLWTLPDVIGMTGGGSTKLDGYVTAGVTVGLVVALVDANAGSPIWRAYQLTAATTAESAPSIIRPDDYATSTNEKVWRLVSTATSADGLAVAFDPDHYTPATTTLASHLEGIDDVLGTVLTTRVGVYREMAKGAAEFVANAGSPTISDVTFGSIKLKAATFADNETDAVQVAFRMPAEWDDTVNPKVKLEWTGADAGDVRFEVSVTRFGQADSLTASLATATAFTATLSSANLLQLSTAFTPANTGDGHMLLITVQRTGANAADTLAAAVYLTGVVIQFEEKETEPVVWA
jgi:hypothetical protein